MKKEEKKIVLAYDKQTKKPIKRSIWDLTSYNGFIVGQTGMGKTVLAKYLIEQEVQNNTSVFVIDMGSFMAGIPEYKDFCVHFGGNYVPFSAKSKRTPNPLALQKNFMFEDSVIEVVNLVQMLLEIDAPLSDAQKSKMYRVLIDMFKSLGIDSSTRSFWKKRQPTLSIFYAFLSKELKNSKDEIEKATFESLISKIEYYLPGELYGFMDQKTGLNVFNQLNVYDLGGIPLDIKATYAMNILRYIMSYSKTKLKKRLIFIENASLWLSNSEFATMFGKFMFEARPSSTGIVLIFQSPDQFLDCKESFTLLHNACFAYIFKYKSVSKVIVLNEKEEKILIDANVGEFVLRLEDEFYNCYIPNPVLYK